MVKSKIYISFSIAPFILVYILAMLTANGLDDLFRVDQYFHVLYFYVYIFLISMSWFSLFLAKKITKSSPFFVALFLFEGIGLFGWGLLFFLSGAPISRMFQEKITLIHVSSIFIFFIVEYFIMSLGAQDKNRKQNFFEELLINEKLEKLNEEFKKINRQRNIIIKSFIVIFNLMLFFFAIGSLVG